MATTLAPVDSRAVVRCDLCGLTQFPTASNLCRRCHIDLDAIPVDDAPELLPQPRAMTAMVSANLHNAIGASVRRLRLAGGLSQRQLALRMHTPRTYVSKVENQKVSPTLASLERLAKALEVSVVVLVADCEVARQDELDELLRDVFLKKFLPFLRLMNEFQFSVVVAKARDLALAHQRGRVTRDV